MQKYNYCVGYNEKADTFIDASRKETGFKL